MSDIRQNVLQAARDYYRMMIDDLEEKQKNYRAQIERENEPTDLDQRSQADMASEDMRRENEQLIQARQGLALLEQMDERSNHDQVENGSIVHTDQSRFLLGVAVPHFDVNGQKYLGVSRESPAYAQMHGKQPGDQVEVEGNTYQIEAVY